MEEGFNDSSEELKIPINKQLFIRTIKDDITKYYEIMRKLGEGSYGKIYLVMNKESNDIRAMKQIVKSKVNNLDTFKREIQILSMVDHPNIVRLFEIFEDDNFFYLIMEYCSGGDLYTRLKDKTSRSHIFSEKEAAIIVKQLISAIAYCHLKGICHRDLKLENILFSGASRDDIKVIDFGCSMLKKPGGGSGIMKSKVGTLYYLSPEIIKGTYDEKCDIWAIGVIMFCLLFGFQPFGGKTDKEVYQNIINTKIEFPKKMAVPVSRQCKELLLNMLCPANKRFSAMQVLRDKWFSTNLKMNGNAPEFFDDSRFKQYKSFNIFKKLALIFIASRLNSQETLKYKELYSLLDRSQTGILSKEDFTKCLICNEPINIISEEEIYDLFDAIDVAQNGNIDYSEFLAAYIDKETYTKEENLKETFNAFCQNDIGIITKNEILRLFNLEHNTKNSEVANKLIEKNDFNEDGRIDYTDFLKIMKGNEV